jgi:rubredoxin
MTNEPEQFDPWRYWMCPISGWIYSEEEGAPEHGLPPGTRWEEVPTDFFCPNCGAQKEQFNMVAMRRRYR